MQASPTVNRPPGSRRWLAFFVVLSVLGILAVSLPIFYNLGQQLKPEQLAQARALWEERGPRDYDLSYTLMVDRDTYLEQYAVQVRNGRTVFAAGEGQVWVLDPAVGFLTGVTARGVVAPEGRAFGIEALFDRIEQVLKADPEAGKRNLAVAAFDPNDGHPRRFVHRVRGTSQREEWIVRLKPVPLSPEDVSRSTVQGK